jgi:hypothetical protein
MLKILTTASEEELAVIVSVIQKIKEKKIPENSTISNWAFCSKTNRGDALNWEKKTKSFWSLENKNS